VHKEGKKNFWTTKKAMGILRKTGRKTETANLVLNLERPYDFIIYKIAKISPRVAPSWAERNESKEYEFVIIDGEVQLEEELNFTKLKATVLKYLFKNETSKRKLYDLLRMYGVESTSRQVNYKKVNTEFIFSELLKITDRKSEIPKLQELVTLGEKDISSKIFLADCITIGLIEKRGPYEYRFVSGDKFANNEIEAITWFSEAINRDTKLRFEQAIEEYYKDNK